MYKIFNIAIPSDGIEETEMNRFLASHRIVAVRTQWVTSGDVPYEVFTVEYAGGSKTGGSPFPAVADAQERVPPVRVDYRKILEPAQFIRYCKMRDARKKIADEEAVKALPVKERIVHHALIAVIGGRLERSLIDKAYACRRGKGQWAAVAEARWLASRSSWCLKLDVKSFFDSVDHEVLLRLLARKIKDRRVMALIRQLVASYETQPGKGLPIGNLTSQYFANLYLDGLDRFVAAYRIRGHVRYMDDLVVFGGHDVLKQLLNAVSSFLEETLKLTLNAKGGLHKMSRGVDFLGTRVFPDRVMLARRSKVRFRRKTALLDGMLASGMMSERRYQARMTQLFAFVRNCDSESFRCKVISEGAQGELSSRARRGLEQQQQRRLCRRVPLRVSQLQLQQHEPEQQQQYLGLSRCLLPRSSRANCERRQMSLRYLLRLQHECNREV